MLTAGKERLAMIGRPWLVAGIILGSLAVLLLR